MIILGMVDIADSFMPGSFVDRTIHSRAEEALLEELRGRGKVARILFVT